MKKATVFFIVTMVVFWACSAQKAEAQSANIAQKIIGTWIDNFNGTTWVISVNGTLTVNGKEYKFGVTDTKLAIFGGSGTYENPVWKSIYDISISSDGKTLILTGGDADAKSGGSWFTKK